MIDNKEDFFISLKPISIELIAEKRLLNKTKNIEILTKKESSGLFIMNVARISEKIKPMHRIVKDIASLKRRPCLIICANCPNLLSVLSFAENFINAGFMPKSVNRRRKDDTAIHNE